MSMLRNTACLVAAALAAPALAGPLADNGSFETPGIGFAPFADWETFTTNAFADDNVEVTAQDGVRSCKMFGGFPGPCGQSDSLVQQVVPATAGNEYTLSAYTLSLSTDPLTPNDFGVDCAIGELRGHLPLLIIDFLDAGNNVIGSESVNAFDITVDPTDTWIQRTVTGTAPSGTVSAQLTCLLIQFDDSPGSLFWDNVCFEENTTGPGPCSPADLAEPFGVLDFFDVLEFLSIFDAGCP